MKKLSFFLMAMLFSVMSFAGTVTKTIDELVTEYDWTVSVGSEIGTLATEFALDEVVTISTTGEANCGTIWLNSDKHNWRLYQAKAGDITIAVKAGYQLKTINLIYTVSNNGTLLDGTTTVASGTDLDVTGLTSKTLVVGNTSDKTNGQVRITQFSVTYVATGGTTEPETPVEPEEPETPVEPEEPETPIVPEGAITCAEALAICLETGETSTTETYTIQGYVTEIKTVYNSQYGNISFWMADTKDGGQVLQAYRVKPVKAGEENVKVGDFVEVQGTLVNYKSNTPEVNAGGTYTILTAAEGGETPEPELPEVETVGAGTEENPFTVEDVIALNNTLSGKQYVKAYIVGQVNGVALAAGAEFEAPFTPSTNSSTGVQNTYNTNLLIASSADENDPAKCVPVQLPSGDVRTNFNLPENPEMDGKLVLLNGDLVKYFNVPGIKNTASIVVVEEAEPEVATWTVAGNPIFGESWNPAHTANDMTLQADGTYKWEKTEIELAANTKIEFKVVKDNAWGEEYPSSNYVLNITEAGFYTITITFNAETKEVNAVATKTADSEIVVNYEYVLMGVAGDWETGIALTQNPDNANEYMLIGQEILAGDAVKVVTLANGEKSAYCGNVEEWTTVAYEFDKDGNIVLAPGLYDFYYKVDADVIYIGGEAYEPEIDWIEMPLEITNLTTEVMEAEGAKYLRLMGRDDMNDADVMLFLNNYTGEEKAYEVNTESAYVTFGGLELTVMDGSITKSVDPELGDVYAGVVHASVEDEEIGGTMYIALSLTMYAAEPIEVVVENATVTLNEYKVNETESAYELTMVADWTYEKDGLTYEVECLLPTFDPTNESGNYAANFYVIGDGAAFGMAEGANVLVTVENQTLKLTGEISALNGNVYNVTISGTLPAEEPDYFEIVDDITDLIFNGEMLAFMGGPSANFYVELFLVLTGETQDDQWPLDLENSSISIMGQDVTIIDGYLYDLDVINPDAPAAKALLHVESEGQLYEVKLNMTSAAPQEAIVIEVEDANCVVEPYSTTGMGEPNAKMLTLTADWTNPADDVVYTVQVKVKEFKEDAAGDDHEIEFEIGTMDNFLGFGEGVAGVMVNEGVVSIEADVTAWNGTAFELYISGTLPAEEPEVPSALDNVTTTVAPAKAIVNGQLVIVKDGVQYNAQGAVIK